MKLRNLSPDKKKQLKEYLDSLNEIKKSIDEILKEVNLKVKTEKRDFKK